MNREVAAPRLADTLLEGRGFAALLALYILVFYLLRLMLSPTIAVDDVAEAIFSQSLQWSYYHRQPPLYDWLLWGTFRLFGVSIAALFLLKYALVALGYVFYYLSAREIFADRRLVFAAALSPSLIYHIGYGVHVGFTNSVLLTAACAATFYAFLRLVRRGALVDYLFFGAALAVGLLSKWGFPAFAAALVAAGLCQESARRRLLDPRILPGLALAAALIVPFLVFGFHDSAKMGNLFKDALREGGRFGYWPGVVSGFEELPVAIAGFLAPFWIFAAAIFPRAVMAPSHKPEARTAEAGAFDVRRLLEHFFLIMAVVLAIGVLAAGVSQYKSRWMHAVLILFPLYFFCRVQDAGFSARQFRLWATVLGLTAFVVFAARLIQDGVGDGYCGRCRLEMPYPELAKIIGADGFEGGTIVAHDEHIAGNFRLAFPEARVVSYPYDNYLYYFPPLPPDAAGQCLIVWNANVKDALPYGLTRFLKEGLDVEVPPSAAINSVTAPYRHGVKRMLSLHYVLLPATGRCR